MAVCLVLAECNEPSCTNGLFAALIEKEPELEKKLIQKFRLLFKKGLFEHLSFILPSSGIKNVFGLLMKNCPEFEKKNYSFLVIFFRKF